MDYTIDNYRDMAIEYRTTAMNRLICLLLALIVVISLSACSSNPTPEPTEPTEPINWSVVEEVGRDGDEVHYRIYSSNGMTVDRYTMEGE